MALLDDYGVPPVALPPPAAAAGRATRARPVSILLLACNYGGGHLSAARALRDWWAREQPGWTITVVDHFDRFVPPFTARATEFGYLQSVRHVPAAYNLFYQLTNRIPSGSRGHRWLSRFGQEGLGEYLRAHPVDLAVAVHPTPAGALSGLRSAGLTDCRLATIITDFVVHRQWIQPRTDLYVAGAECVAEGLRAQGVPPERIVTCGIPIRAEFAAPLDRAALRQRLRLRPELPGILVMVGADGMLRKVHEVYEALAELPAEVLFVCGRDRGLQQRLERLSRGRAEFRVAGFAENVAELMAAYDILVGKAGGLTVSEALASGIPAVIYRPIPGQEHANRDYAVRTGAAVAARSRRELRERLAELCASAELRARMGAAARAAGRPRAAPAAAAALAALLDGRAP